MANRKTIIIIGDGMADEPIPEFGNATILEAAHTPYMDLLAKKGSNGVLVTVPPKYHPGSEIANLSILGYNLDEVFEGRGSLEAASIGVDINNNEMAMRCNLICIDNKYIKNHSAGHISTEEAHQLIIFLQKKVRDSPFSFHTGTAYRHLLKMKGGNKHITCTPPHDVPGTLFKHSLIKANNSQAEETAQLLNELMLNTQVWLKDHPINLKRIDEGKDPANGISLWSPGYHPKMKTMQELYGIKKGAVISAVDLIRGIGIYAGLDIIKVDGATGLYNTNYTGKVNAALEALKSNDFIYLHIEASDEAGHEGDFHLKKRTVEDLDAKVIGPIYEATKHWNNFTIAVLPDHPTPCLKRTHTNSPVPFIIYSNNCKADKVTTYSENEAPNGEYKTIANNDFIKITLNLKKV